MKQKQSTLSVQATATEGQWLYERDALMKIREFREAHVGTDVTIRFEAHDGVQYFQHKYYRGYVLKAIAEAHGYRVVKYPSDENQGVTKKEQREYMDELHFELKQRFLKIPVSDWREIPSRHRKSSPMIIMNNGGVVAYVPSTACLNFEEMRDYILSCENIRDGLTDWHYEDPVEMAHTRALAFREVA